MADTYFVGLRATDDVVANERPESWREGILRMYPNGKAPLTGLTALMKGSSVDDPHFHWWTKTFSAFRSAVTGVYTDSTLASAYVSGGVAGTTLFLKMAVTYINMFRVGHQVLIRLSTNYALDTVGKVVSVVTNGASSYIGVRLLEADDNGGTVYLASCDTVLVVGNMNAQGATRPEAITQGPSEFDNRTHIFRNALDMSRTMMKTKLRTVDAYTEAKRDALEQHSVDMEQAWWFSTLYVGTGSNGKPEYATRGLLSWIREYGTVQDYSLDTDVKFAGKGWLEAGEEWIDEHLEEIFRYGSDERLGFVGSGALLGIQRLVKDLGMTTLTPRTTTWGSNVREWTTPFGQITLKTHPLFSLEPTNRYSLALIEPANLRYRYIDDTKFMPDNAYGKGGGTGYDGKQEEFLTEAGLEIYFPNTCAFLNSIGKDNSI